MSSPDIEIETQPLEPDPEAEHEARYWIDFRGDNSGVKKLLTMVQEIANWAGITITSLSFSPSPRDIGPGTVYIIAHVNARSEKCFKTELDRRLQQ